MRGYKATQQRRSARTQIDRQLTQAERDAQVAMRQEKRITEKAEQVKWEGLPPLERFGRTAFERWQQGERYPSRPPLTALDIARIALNTALVRYAQARRSEGKERERLLARAEHSADFALRTLKLS